MFKKGGKKNVRMRMQNKEEKEEMNCICKGNEKVYKSSLG
jgi:hypothetical protein